MTKRLAASAAGIVGICLLAACGASAEGGTQTTAKESPSDIRAALTLPGLSACTERTSSLPMPSPVFAAATSYETTIPESGDPAVVFAPTLSPELKGRITFPAVVVLQGGSVLNTNYSEFSQRLARYGYVVIVPHHVTTIGTQTGPFTNVRVATQGFEFLKAESARVGSPIEQTVDATRLAVVGHSLGGAQTLFAAGNVCSAPLCYGEYQRPAELKAVVTYGANLRARPPATGYTDVDTTGVATLMIQGSQDAIALIEHGRATFANLEEPKSFFRVNGATHYGITNEHNQGGQTEPPPALPQEQGLDAIAASTAIFLAIHVYGDGSLAPSLDCFTGTSDGVVTFED